jgi:hypothetical protein
MVVSRDGSWAVIEHLKQYGKPSLTARLNLVDRIGDDFYDWSLNAVD